MEDQKTTSEYLFEDDYSFLNQEEELFLKKGAHHEQRKIGKVNPDDLEEKLAGYRKAYEELKEKVRELEEIKEPAENQIRQLEKEINTAKAVGNFDKLLSTLKDLKKSTDSGEEEQEDEKDESGAEQENEMAEEVEEDPEKYYRDIVKKATELSKQSDWPYVAMELDNLSHQWSDGPDLESDNVKKLFQKFNRAVETFEKRKEEHYEKLNNQKRENLEKKQNLLEKLEKIVSEKKWSATGQINNIKGQWNSTGILPSDKGDDLDKKFNELIKVFNDHKVDRLVQQRQKEEDNLMLKLVVLEKMEKIAGSIDEDTSSWKKVDEDFDDLTKQWKKIGRVPKEKANEVWERYKNAQDEYYDRKYKFDKKHQNKVDKFYGKKEQICKEAEALLEEEDLASAARDINKLHRRWKKIGNLPQRAEDELWSRFKAATDAFNKRKSENSDKIQQQEEEHYQQKLDLIEKAEEVKTTDNWDKGHQAMQNLMQRWKEIGPVPRKKSNKIWKKFKGAMDEFYDRRREHFKKVKKQRKGNLKEKQEILEKLQELGQHEDPIEAVNIAKPLQEKFKEAGYVPIKKKNKIWKQYRKACDVIYDRFRAAKSGDKFDQELAKAELDNDDRKKIQKLRSEFKKVEKSVRSLEEEVLQYKESKTYFKPSGDDNSLINEINEKIEKTQQKLEEKQDKLDSLTEEMEEIRLQSE